MNGKCVSKLRVLARTFIAVLFVHIVSTAVTTIVVAYRCVGRIITPPITYPIRRVARWWSRGWCRGWCYIGWIPTLTTLPTSSTIPILVETLVGPAAAITTIIIIRSGVEESMTRAVI